MTQIAMDVHRKRSTLAYMTPGLEEPKVVRCFTTRPEFAKVLSGLPGPWVVCLEATRQSPAVVRWLRELGVGEIHLVNPQELHEFAKDKPKSDARDAKEMLRLQLLGGLPECYLACHRVQEARALSRGRQLLRKVSTVVRNGLRALLNQQGLDLACRDLCGRRAQEQLPAVIAQLPPLTQGIVTVLLQLLAQVESALAAADGLIADQVAQEPIAQALTQLAGIGPILAFGLVAELGEIERFADPAHLVSYAGLAPRANDSDEFHGSRHLPRRCNKRLRHLAILAAQSAARSREDSRARHTYHRLRERLKPNTAKIAAARALLTEVFYVWQQAVAPPARAA
jgi:transposase